MSFTINELFVTTNVNPPVIAKVIGVSITIINGKSEDAKPKMEFYSWYSGEEGHDKADAWNNGNKFKKIDMGVIPAGQTVTKNFDLMRSVFEEDVTLQNTFKFYLVNELGKDVLVDTLEQEFDI